MKMRDRGQDIQKNCPVWFHRSLSPPGPLSKREDKRGKARNRGKGKKSKQKRGNRGNERKSKKRKEKRWKQREIEAKKG